MFAVLNFNSGSLEKEDGAAMLFHTKGEADMWILDTDDLVCYCQSLEVPQDQFLDSRLAI
jgi:hypothetical protein